MSQKMAVIRIGRIKNNSAIMPQVKVIGRAFRVEIISGNASWFPEVCTIINEHDNYIDITAPLSMIQEKMLDQYIVEEF